jgi:tripartite-type tricarboxylate transporter receptor subunit TctC
MPDETITITLPASDWQIIQVSLYELPAKTSVPVISRLNAAMNEAQKSDEVVPFVPTKQGSKANG